jgi:hypothetical protein
VATEASIEGVAAFGLGWKYRLSGLITPEVELLKSLNEKVEDDQDLTNKEESALEDAVNSMVKKLRKWAESPKIDKKLKEKLLDELDYLEINADSCLDDINYQMSKIYDVFDYYRVLAG